MSEHITETSAIATLKPHATVAAQAAGDAMAWYVLGPPRGSLRLTTEQIRDLQDLIRTHRDESMLDPAACLESLWATLIDRLNAAQ